MTVIPVIEVRDACVELDGRIVLEHIDFTLNRGETLALIGPNGAGKTTLVRALLGLAPLRCGEMLLFGRSVVRRQAASRVGYVPQRLEFDRTLPLTVWEMMRAYAPKASREQVIHALEQVGAGSLIDRTAGALSGGQLQRVVIALNLLRKPELLLLDEPATGVDSEGELRFYDLIEHLRQSMGLTVVMVSHDLTMVSRYATRVLCVNREMICFGSTHEALTDTALIQLFGQDAARYHHGEHHH